MPLMREIANKINKYEVREIDIAALSYIFFIQDCKLLEYTHLFSICSLVDKLKYMDSNGVTIWWGQKLKNFYREAFFNDSGVRYGEEETHRKFFQ
jgi:hypothetical protein